MSIQGRMTGMLPGMLPRMLPGVVEAASRAAVTEFPGPIERSDERDAALLAIIPLVPELGWSPRALRRAVGPDADLLFPGGAAEMVEAHSDLGDRRMEQAALEDAGAETRVSARVRRLLLLRLEQAEAEREAIRRGLSVLSLPGNRLAALRSLARTVDAVWHAAGDQSADASWYSKRAILAGVYSATLLFWLRDESGGSATEAFLDRRLAGVARFGRTTGAARRGLAYAASRAATWSGGMRTSAS
jgi:ubiquinone biosynthesis protein COQ9